MTTVNGNEANNTLFGGPANDSLFGFGGNDRLFGGPGADVLDGGDGRDMAIYSQALLPVTVSLQDGKGTTGEATNDTLISIEGITGTAFDDTLIGDHASNWLNGGQGNDHLIGNGGNDWISGGRGADVLEGGAGVDWLRYMRSDTGITIDLGMNTAQGGHAEGDVISGFENVEGSRFADVLIGSSQDNVLRGGNGNDQLFGGDGNDKLIGGLGLITWMEATALIPFPMPTRPMQPSSTREAVRTDADHVVTAGNRSKHSSGPASAIASSWVTGTIALSVEQEMTLSMAELAMTG